MQVIIMEFWQVLKCFQTILEAAVENYQLFFNYLPLKPGFGTENFSYSCFIDTVVLYHFCCLLTAGQWRRAISAKEGSSAEFVEIVGNESSPSNSSYGPVGTLWRMQAPKWRRELASPTWHSPHRYPPLCLWTQQRRKLAVQIHQSNGWPLKCFGWNVN